MIFATVITDASHCSETFAGGWAAYIRIDNCRDAVCHHAAFKKPLRTSAEAELLAAVNGLWVAQSLGAERMLLQTDCLAVVNLVNGHARRGTLLQTLSKACKVTGLDLSLVSGRHVRGHTKVKDARSYVNRWCDRMAKEAMREQRAQISAAAAPIKIAGARS